ncbi:MAG: hypothetical protein KDC36_04210 [Thermoleophilia bacterium]|nr:hypothetical protein [Thermoleophilia bacterium]
MPLYEYRCNACGRNFEVVQSMTADPLTECDECGGEVVRVLHAPAIHFKGSGFHNTDYGTKRRPAGGDGDSGGGSGDAKSKPAGESGGTSGDSSSGASGGGSGSSKPVGLDKV